ncbi:hypothetical protein [Polaromonas glacialis]|uniref:hypothetical protein n=1 Tax=Polaromonas glacialis TaxID=866564 RepID=UPI000AD000CB|nr:hypothetical protein [Polaromonas glacialis]
MPASRASLRMALVAFALIATGITGCADMTGIQSQGSLRDVTSLSLSAVTVPVPVIAE